MDSCVTVMGGLNAFLTGTSMLLAFIAVITGLSIIYRYQHKMQFSWLDFDAILKMKLPVRLYLGVHFSTLASSLYILLIVDWVARVGWLTMGDDYNFFFMIYHNAALIAAILFHRHIYQSLTYKVTKDKV